MSDHAQPEVLPAHFDQVQDTAEVLLGRLLTHGAVCRALVEQFSDDALTLQQAKRAVATVRERWQAEEPTEVRMERRRQLRAAAEDVFRDARHRTRTVGVKDDHGVHVPLTVDEPDYTICMRVLEFLGRLDGLMLSEHMGGVPLGSPEAEGTAGEIRARLDALMESLPPEERGRLVDALLTLERAAPGSTALAMMEGSNGSTGNGRTQGNGSTAE